MVSVPSYIILLPHNVRVCSLCIVHCRRRKIRCLLAADDPQGRCESCIRLKRVCIFSPADHKPSMEKKRQTESSMDPFLAVPSTSPPPSMTSVSIETPSIYRNPQSVTSGAAELDSTPITSSSSLSQVATGQFKRPCQRSFPKLT